MWPWLRSSDDQSITGTRDEALFLGAVRTELRNFYSVTTTIYGRSRPPRAIPSEGPEGAGSFLSEAPVVT